MTIDDDPCYLYGIKDFVQDGTQSAIGFGGWYDFSEELITARNESIREWWTPERRKAKSEQTKLNHRNHDPEVNAKRSAAVKISNNTPEVRAKISAAAKIRWARHRAAKQGQ